jgi:hypothetical protein
MKLERTQISHIALLVIMSALFFVLGQEKTAAQTQAAIYRDDCSQFAKVLSGTSSRAEDLQFLACFLHQPPRERIRLWQAGLHAVGVGTEMTELLIAQGTDTASLLAALVRDKKSYYRFHALKLLCDMDRFVPSERLPIPEDEFVNEQVQGLMNDFMVVDGRRIDSEVYATVKWAAEQTEDTELRFCARKYTGLLDKDLEKLSLTDVVKQWREAVIKCKGHAGLESKVSSMMHHLQKTLIARVPESLPILTEILNSDSSGYVREQAITVVRAIDNRRVRLRGIEEGRRAIEAVRLAIERGGLKPTYDKKNWRKELWEELESQFLRDYWFVHDEQNGGISQDGDFYANTLDEMYGTGTKVSRYVPTGKPDIRPTIRRFITYLTEIDPYYPSWEYISLGPPWEGVCHPLFQRKIARYNEAWKGFMATQGNSTRQSTQ